MTADLRCPRCNGEGKVYAADEGEWTDQGCPDCDGSGRRRPYLAEWDALEAERDRYHAALAFLAVYGDERWKTVRHPMNRWVSKDTVQQTARAALDSDPDLAERTQESR